MFCWRVCSPSVYVCTCKRSAKIQSPKSTSDEGFSSFSIQCAWVVTFMVVWIVWNIVLTSGFYLDIANISLQHVCTINILWLLCFVQRLNEFLQQGLCCWQHNTFHMGKQYYKLSPLPFGQTRIQWGCIFRVSFYDLKDTSFL